MSLRALCATLWRDREALILSLSGVGGEALAVEVSLWGGSNRHQSHFSSGIG
jgi:hypothetical protein